MCAGADTSVSSKLSVNSSNHSGRSRKRSSESRLSSLYFCSGFLRVICTSLLGKVRHFVLELELLRNPAMPMLTTNCFQKRWITLEQREVRSCPLCIHLSSLPWSTVVSDLDLDRERRLVPPRLCALLHDFDTTFGRNFRKQVFVLHG